MRKGGFALILLVLGGCAGQRPNLPSGTQSYASFPAPVPGRSARDYVIGALDIMDVTVFQEPDLSVKNVQVDAGGFVLLPLVGNIRAAGLSTTQFSRELADRLSVRYLNNPQVSAVITSSSSQRVTVEGSVTDPGIFEIRGRTTLLDALALAKGPSRVAKLNEVVIFRDINGQREGALFDLRAIRAGRMEDPEILGDDTVVVGLSNVKATFRDILSAVPLFTVFSPLY